MQNNDNPDQDGFKMISEKSVNKIDKYLSEIRNILLHELEIKTNGCLESSIEISQGGVKDQVFLNMKTSCNISLRQSG